MFDFEKFIPDTPKEWLLASSIVWFIVVAIGSFVATRPKGESE